MGLSLENGALPGPICYKLELRDTEKSDEWHCVLDRTDSAEDLIIDYRVFDTCRANEAKLTIVDWPKGIKPGVMNISIFGYWTPKEENL